MLLNLHLTRKDVLLSEKFTIVANWLFSFSFFKPDLENLLPRINVKWLKLYFQSESRIMTLSINSELYTCNLYSLF